jgi:hypothetical protein
MLSYRPRPANGLFISPSTKIAVVPLHWEQHAVTRRAAPRPIALCHPHVLRIQPRLPDPPTVTARQQSNAIDRTRRSNDRTCRSHCACARDALIGRAPRNDWTQQCQRPVVVQRARIATGRVRSRVIGRVTRPISSSPRSTPLGARPDALVPRGTRRADCNPNTRAPDCYVELTGHVRSNRDRVRCSVRAPL